MRLAVTGLLGLALLLSACNAKAPKPVVTESSTGLNEQHRPAQAQAYRTLQSPQDGAHPIDLLQFTPEILKRASDSAGRSDLFADIQLVSAWQVTEETALAAGATSSGAGVVVRLDPQERVRLIGIGVRGAPGPADIVDVQGDIVVIRQGLGYVGYNYKTEEVSPLTEKEALYYSDRCCRR